MLPSDADPTAVTTVVNAVLAEDDLAPLDPDDGAQTPPTIGQPEPDAEAGRPPVAPTRKPAAPATAEFSLSDIASQGEPDRAGDTPLPPPSLGNEPWRLDEDAPQPETAQIEAVEIQPVEPETAQIEAVEIQPVEVEAVQLEAADLEPARIEGVEPGTIDLESDKIQSDEIESSEIKPEIESSEIENESFKFEFESLEFATVEPETTQSRAEPPKVEGPNDATAPPKQRGLFRRRRDRRRAALNEAADRGRLDAVREKPTTEDEPVFISAREPLFTEPEPDSAPADEPRPRRNVTLPPDITPPDSWVEPAQAEPNEPLDGPTVAATTPFDTDEGLFADRLPPSDSPARPNHEETIGWRSDEPETAPLGQRFDLFKEEHEPQVDPEDETTPTSTAEAITGPPTEAEDHVDTETENHADPSPIADPIQQVDTDAGPTLPVLAVGEKRTAAALSVQEKPTLPMEAVLARLGEPDAADTRAAAEVAASYAALGRVRDDVVEHLDEVPLHDEVEGDQSLLGQLQVVAKCILLGAPTRAYSVSLRGFDTHGGEKATQTAQLRTEGPGRLAPRVRRGDHVLLRIRAPREGERLGGHRPRHGGRPLPDRRPGEGGLPR